MQDDATPAERFGALAGRIIPEIEAAIEELAARPGGWTKARAETINSLSRLLEGFIAFSRSAAEKKRRAEEDENDIAAILAAIDKRIVELAGALAGRLGEPEPVTASAS